MSNTLRSVILCAAVLLATLQCSARAQGPSYPPMGPASGPAVGFGPVAAPPPGPDCQDALLNMSACLTFVEVGSKLRVPDTGCCPGLSGLVNSQPVCLCQLLASADVYGVKIDTARALTLPTACHVQTPDVSLCSLLGVPVPSPIAPAMSPTSGSGSESPGANPSTGSSSPASSPPSGGARIFTSTILMLFLSLMSGLTLIL